jgi:hypothetical protein
LGSLTFSLADVAVITVAWYNTMTDAILVTDSNNNTWAKVPNTFQQSAASNLPGQQLWWSTITNPGTGITITATFPVTASYPAIYGCECSGVSSIDQSASATGTGTETSPNITTTAAATFIYGSVYDGTFASSSGAGWTEIGATYNTYVNEYQIASSVGTFAATSSVSSGLFTAAIVAFKLGSAPSASRQPVIVLY